MGAPNAWQTRDVALTSLVMPYPTDPEPEYVSINDNNVAVITLQENNHIALVDLVTGTVTRDFTAGSTSLTQIDRTYVKSVPTELSLTERRRYFVLNYFYTRTVTHYLIAFF